MSNTIMISCGIRCSRVVVLTILTPIMIATRLDIMSVRMSQRSQIVFGVSRYLAIRALGWVAPIFSLPKRYHSKMIAGTRRSTMGCQNAIFKMKYYGFFVYNPVRIYSIFWYQIYRADSSCLRMTNEIFYVFSFTVSSLLICPFSSIVRSCWLYSARSRAVMISMSLGSWVYEAIRPGRCAQLWCGW